jgi:4'-phosphopantetheinyl transferase
VHESSSLMLFEKLSSNPNILHSSLNSVGQIYISEQWGSTLEGSREDLQKFIDSQKPQHFSISHAPGIGGVFFSDSVCGLDLELTDRVTEKIVRRVSSQEEWSLFEELSLPCSYLWCAKEAAWKCLRGRHQPSTISEVTLRWIANDRTDLDSSTLNASFVVHSVQGSDGWRDVKGSEKSFNVRGAVFQQGAYTLSWAK